jgi:hypothetical protein
MSPFRCLLFLVAAVHLSYAATDGPPAGSVGDYPSANLSITTHPVGNGWPTTTTLNIEGTTSKPASREFLVNIGLVSNQGSLANSTPYRDKVALYTSIEAHNGTGDVWAINPLLTQMPNSGEYVAQGIELDFNNNNEHRGELDAGAGLRFPGSFGLSITGASTKRSTAAMLVCGNRHNGTEGGLPQWNRGIVFANNAIAQSTIQDLTSPHKSIDIRGNPTFGIYQSSSKSSNWLNGKTGIGEVNHSLYGTEYMLSVNGHAISAGTPLRTNSVRPTLLAPAESTTQTRSTHAMLRMRGERKNVLGPFNN